jgi:hypothetical protein
MKREKSYMSLKIVFSLISFFPIFDLQLQRTTTFDLKEIQP